MARRKGRPRRLAPAPKEGPDRKSLVKYVDDGTCEQSVQNRCMVHGTGQWVYIWRRFGIGSL